MTTATHGDTGRRRWRPSKREIAERQERALTRAAGFLDCHPEVTFKGLLLWSFWRYPSTHFSAGYLARLQALFVQHRRRQAAAIVASADPDGGSKRLPDQIGSFYTLTPETASRNRQEPAQNLVKR